MKQEEINNLKTNLISFKYCFTKQKKIKIYPLNIHLRSKYESDVNSKDLLVAELRIKNEEQTTKLNSKLDHLKTQNEQLKSEVELNKKNELNLMQKYQDQMNTNSVYLRETETLKNEYQSVKNSFDSFKAQSKNYESLIDDSNNQVFN